MQLPLVLKGFNLFVEGSNLHGLLVDVTRPKVAMKTETYQGGGMVGEVTLEQGIEAMEMEITAKGYSAELLRQFGGTIAGKTVRYQGALQQDDEEGYSELVGEARGRFVETDRGSDKQAEGGESKFKFVPTYWKETLNGEELVEIDLLGQKFAVAGDDRLKGFRAALGL